MWWDERLDFLRRDFVEFLSDGDGPGDFAFFWAGFEARREAGILPIRGSPERTRSQAWSSFLEIRRIGRKNLPAGHFLAQQPDGTHIRKLCAQTCVMLCTRGQPDSVVGDVSWFVAQDENDLLPNVTCKAAKHGTSPGREGSKRIEDEFVWHSLT